MGNDKAKQSVLVSKKVAASRKIARAIAKKYADRIYTARETKDYYRFRQRPPKDFADAYSTANVGEGIKIVYGKLKKKN